jgi:hypothetical protein
MNAKSGMGGFTDPLFVEALYDSGMTLQDIDKAAEFFRLWQMRNPPGRAVLANAAPGKSSQCHPVG